MRFPISLPTYRWYWYVLLGLAALLLLLTMPPLSKKVRTVAHLYQSEGLSELAYRARRSYNLLGEKPNIEWESAQPEAAGFDPAILSDLGNQMAELGTQALLIAKDGKIVHEYYAPDFGPNHRLRLSAAGKAIAASIALAVELDAGLVELDSLASQFIHSWQDDPVKSKITVRHLIAHSSGIENVPWGQPGLQGWQDEFSRDLSSRFPLSLQEAPIRFQPGSRFQYSSTGYYPLSYVLTASLEKVPESDIRKLLQNRIMSPLGIPNSAWQLDFAGPHSLDGLELYYAGEGRYTARAIARIGQLMLDKGTWEGRKLIRPETVDALVSYGQSPDIRPSDLKEPTWGLGWRLNDDGFFPSLPRDSFLALRPTDKVVLVVPSLGLVVVRFGDQLTDKASNEHAWAEMLDEHLFRPLMESVIR